MTSSGRRELLVSKAWVQAVALVVLFGFFVLGLLAYRTYQAKPPIPQRVVDPNGQVPYRAADIRKGQQVFLHNGLMEYGSVFGHGAYLGFGPQICVGQTLSVSRRRLGEFRYCRPVRRALRDASRDTSRGVLAGHPRARVQAVPA